MYTGTAHRRADVQTYTTHTHVVHRVARLHIHTYGRARARTHVAHRYAPAHMRTRRDTRTHFAAVTHPTLRHSPPALCCPRTTPSSPHKTPAWHGPGATVTPTVIPIRSRAATGRPRPPDPQDHGREPRAASLRQTVPTCHRRGRGGRNPASRPFLGPHSPQSSSGRKGSPGLKGDSMVRTTPPAPPNTRSGPWNSVTDSGTAATSGQNAAQRRCDGGRARTNRLGARGSRASPSENVPIASTPTAPFRAGSTFCPAVRGKK